MSQPSWVWGIFTICFLVATAATGWISYTMLRLDRADYEARKQAEQEENVRLALWRMESTLAPLIAKENSRPSGAYQGGWDWPASPSPAPVVSPTRTRQQSVVSDPVQRSVQWLEEDRAGGNDSTQRYQQLSQVAPDLVMESSPGILVHFLIGPDGATSPQLQNDSPPPQFAARLQDLNDNFDDVAPHLDFGQLLGRLPEPEAQPAPPPTPEWQIFNSDMFGTNALDNVVAYGGKLQKRQTARNQMEYAARQTFQEQNGALMSQQRDATPATGELGVMKAVWHDDRLLLARRSRTGDLEKIEGCWLNWKNLQQVLLDEVNDLVPNATLHPIVDEQTGSRSAHRLATIPVLLSPGEMPFPPMPLLTPARTSLVVAWVFLVLAAIAVAILLGGTLSLSERRHDFVSAVTHELRTPLTTFRMYSEMLAGGMVAEEKRQGYLEKLQHESDRLGHLVENVLAFARVERSSRTEERSEIKLRRFLNGLKARLSEHAQQQGMKLSLKQKIGEDAHTARIAPGTIEQILVNLVDNSCKYGRNRLGNSANQGSPDCGEIVVSVTTTNNDLIFSVEDWGPGVDAETARRLFRPFSKSDSKAAASAPGVGLGLALSRRLARAMNGDLTYEGHRRPGARFDLRVPRK
ncbi:MAG: HAMP domain-containing sensor histidine kinase [Planctomycetota bacterium]